MKKLLRLIRRYMPDYGRKLLFFVLLTTIVTISEMLTLSMTGSISEAAKSIDLPAIRKTALVMAAATLVKLIFGLIRTFLAGHCSGEAEDRLRVAFAKQHIFAPYRRIASQSSGEALSTYANDLPKTAKLITLDFFQLLSEIALFLTALVYMLCINAWITLVFFTLFPLLMFVQVRISAPIQPLAADAAAKKAEYNAVVVDSLQNTTTLVAYSLESKMEERYMASYQKYFEATNKRIAVYSKLILIGQLTSLTPYLILLVFSALSVISGRLAFGGFVSLAMFGEEASNFLIQLAQRISGIRQSTASGYRMADSVSGEPEYLDGNVGNTGNVGNGGNVGNSGDIGNISNVGSVKDAEQDAGIAISFDDTSFTYDPAGKEDMAVKGVSLNIEKGSHVAIVGGSGSGKSTLMKLVQTLYQPTTGRVKILGYDSATVPLNTIRSGLSCVPQEPHLFAATLRENITCSDDSPHDDAKLYSACRSAGILDFILDLPEGFDTVIEEGGSSFSGGQKQRLTIARCLYRDATIYLMDEATSALDPSTEAHVLKSIQKATAGRTLLVVAHRFSAIQDCDRILVMEHGTIVEDGSYNELIRRDGPFSHLYQQQLKEETEERRDAI